MLVIGDGSAEKRSYDELGNQAPLYASLLTLSLALPLTQTFTLAIPIVLPLPLTGESLRQPAGPCGCGQRGAARRLLQGQPEFRRATAAGEQYVSESVSQ